MAFTPSTLHLMASSSVSKSVFTIRLTAASRNMVPAELPQRPRTETLDDIDDGGAVHQDQPSVTSRRTRSLFRWLHVSDISSALISEFALPSHLKFPMLSPVQKIVCHQNGDIHCPHRVISSGSSWCSRGGVPWPNPRFSRRLS